MNSDKNIALEWIPWVSGFGRMRNAWMCLLFKRFFYTFYRLPHSMQPHLVTPPSRSAAQPLSVCSGDSWRTGPMRISSSLWIRTLAFLYSSLPAMTQLRQSSLFNSLNFVCWAFAAESGIRWRTENRNSRKQKYKRITNTLWILKCSKLSPKTYIISNIILILWLVNLSSLIFFQRTLFSMRVFVVPAFLIRYRAEPGGCGGKGFMRGVTK